MQRMNMTCMMHGVRRAYGTVVDKNPTVTHAHVIVIVRVNTCVLRLSILIMNSILRNAQYNYRCEGEWEGMSMQAAVSEQQQYAHSDTDSVHKEEIPRSHTICPHVLMDIEEFKRIPAYPS